MRPNKIIEHPVVSAVIAGIILSVLSWVAGIIPPFSVWGDKAIELFKGNMPVPTWVVLLLFFIFASVVVYSLIVTIRLNRLEKLSQQNNKDEESSTVAQTLIEKNTLDDTEIKILQMHAGMQPGYGMTGGELVDDLKLHREEGQYYLEKLEDKDFIEFAFTADTDEPAYQLTKKGRSYLVEKKLLPIENKGTNQ